MKSYRKELRLKVLSRRAFFNISSGVEQGSDETGIKDGLLLVNTKNINLKRKETVIIYRFY